MSTPARPVDSFRMRREDDGRIALEFGARAEPAAGAGAGPAAGFVPSHRIVMPELAAWRLVDGLARALGRPLSSAPAAVPVPAAPVPPAPPPPSRPARVGATVVDLGTDAALALRGTTPLNLPPDPMAERADWLMAAVREMAPGYYEERSFRIAAVTGWGQPADRARSKEAGFDLHFVKPVEMEDLARFIGQAGATFH